MTKGIRRATRALAVMAMAAAAASCSDVSGSGLRDTFDTLLARSTAHGTFRAALATTGVDATLASGGPYTVFAPTDAAFAALPAATRQAIESDPAKLEAVLRNHIVAGRETASRLEDGRQLTTLAGTQVTISRSGNTVRYGNATVTLPNLDASNGVLHVTDQVVLPPGI